MLVGIFWLKFKNLFPVPTFQLFLTDYENPPTLKQSNIKRFTNLKLTNQGGCKGRDVCSPQLSDSCCMHLLGFCGGWALSACYKQVFEELKDHQQRCQWKPGLIWSDSTTEFIGTVHSSSCWMMKAHREWSCCWCWRRWEWLVQWGSVITGVDVCYKSKRKKPQQSTWCLSVYTFTCVSAVSKFCILNL